MQSFKQTLMASGTAAIVLGLMAPAPAAEAALADNTYVTVTGTVQSITDGDTFDLAYNGGVIQVDTNDRWPELFSKDAATLLKPGDGVTVTGMVDDNYFSKKEIDATSIAYRGSNRSHIYWSEPYDTTYYYGYGPYYGSNADEDDVVVSGTVNKIVSDDEFELKYGTSILRVEADNMNTSTLRPGDRVLVYGDMDDKWFGDRELDADRVVRMSIRSWRG